MTDIHDVSAAAGELLEQARSANSGRAATTLYGGADNTLRQTLVALVAGTELAEHESPGEATLHVLDGTVQLRADGDTVDASTGTLVPIPPARHSLLARTDAVVLISVAKTG